MLRKDALLLHTKRHALTCKISWKIASSSNNRWVNSNWVLDINNTFWDVKEGPMQSNSSMHHYECVALCKDISLQRGRFCARSLASCIPRSSEQWMFMNVLHPSCARPPRWSWVLLDTDWDPNSDLDLDCDLYLDLGLVRYTNRPSGHQKWGTRSVSRSLATSPFRPVGFLTLSPA